MASGTQKRIIGIIGLSMSIILFMANGAFSQGTAAKPQAEPQAAPETQMSEFEGVVKIGLGKYFYLPSAQGLDIVIQGKLDAGGDASTLTGKTVRVKGQLLADKPSIFCADSIELKDASGSYNKIFTRSQNLVLNDYLDSTTRDSFKELSITSAAKNEEWEGKGKVKVFGTIQLASSPNESTFVILTDAAGKEIGKIIIDKFTDYATYYLKKLRLFDHFWFYLNVKDTVDKASRIKSRELFHADAAFCGLF